MRQELRHGPLWRLVPDSGLNVRLCLMRARCTSATNPVAPGTASVIPPTKTQAAVPDERLAHAELRTFAHPGYAGDKPNSRPPTIAISVHAGTVLTVTTEDLMR